MAGIALGVAALIIVLSVMNGFRSEVRDRMLSVLSHIEIFSPTGSMPDWRQSIEHMEQAPAVALQLSRALSGNLYIRDWTQHNRTWFIAEQLQKRMLFLILMLIIAVAAFNLVSSLVMTVTQKHGDIAILRTLGAPPGAIMKIFMIQGMTIGLVGTMTGVALGGAIASSIPWLLPLIEHALGIRFLTPSVYFLNELPSKLVAADVIEVALVSFVMSSLATLYPSWRGARIHPAAALRDE
ncbi:FtsX-like permease family protein [Burkholderia sp. A9]|uniref:FtsX-like permease family protein n=1 Tax=Burkholderia sp. A9 TaxID=1365108 RepID=UPI003FA43502